MKKSNFNKLIYLFITFVALYFTGNHLKDLPTLKSLVDGFAVIIFFLSLFPFVSLSIGFTARFFKSLAFK